MKPEKKSIELRDAKKAIFNLLKATNKMGLEALNTEAALSGKQWVKGMKGLSKLGLTKVKVDGDSKFCYLN
jgi:lysyl-tRNA synthetase class 2